MMPEPASHPFVKYVSPVAGHHVERYGTGVVIGGRRQPAPAGTGKLDRRAVSLKELLNQRGAGKLEIDESVIVALTAGEWATHWRAYSRALRKGALKERKAAEYWAKVDERNVARERLAKLVAELDGLSPGAAIKVVCATLGVTVVTADAFDDAEARAKTEKALQEGVVAARKAAEKAAAEAAAPIKLPGGVAVPAGTLPGEAEPLRLTDEELAELRAETPLDDLEAEVNAAAAEGRAPTFAIAPDGAIEGDTDG